MTDQAEPGRPRAHDLAAFDLTKRSPEQLAQSFARWKAQRKRPPEAPRAAEPASPKQSRPSAEDAAGSSSASDRAAAPKRLRSVQYSDTFSNLLAAGSEPTVQRTERPPIVAARPSPNRRVSPGRQLRAMTVLAGAASVLALAGGALLELSDRRKPPQADRVVAQVPAPAVPMATPIAAAALRVPAIDWKLQRTVDLALMKATPTVQRLREPAAPRIETASKAAASSAQGKSASQPAFKEAARETVQFVAKPFVPSVAAAPDAVPAAQRTAATPSPPVAAAIRIGDPRLDALFQHARDNSNGALGNGVAGNRAASSGKPAGAAGSKTAVEARPAAAHASNATSIDGDPRGEGSGGARVAAGGSGAAAGDGNTAVNDGGLASGAADGGTGGRDTGGADTGGSGTAGNDTDGGDTGGSDDAGSDGPSSDGPGGAADGESGPSGEDGDGMGGAIGGRLGGVGEALGGAPGGGSNPDNEDKDQRD